jgi:hypothetical protein
MYKMDTDSVFRYNFSILSFVTLIECKLLSHIILLAKTAKKKYKNITIIIIIIIMNAKYS